MVFLALGSGNSSGGVDSLRAALTPTDRETSHLQDIMDTDASGGAEPAAESPGTPKQVAQVGEQSGQRAKPEHEESVSTFDKLARHLGRKDDRKTEKPKKKGKQLKRSVSSPAPSSSEGAGKKKSRKLRRESSESTVSELRNLISQNKNTGVATATTEKKAVSLTAKDIFYAPGPPPP